MRDQDATCLFLAASQFQACLWQVTSAFSSVNPRPISQQQKRIIDYCKSFHFMSCKLHMPVHIGRPGPLQNTNTVQLSNYVIKESMDSIQLSNYVHSFLSKTHQNNSTKNSRFCPPQPQQPIEAEQASLSIGWLVSS